MLLRYRLPLTFLLLTDGHRAHPGRGKLNRMSFEPRQPAPTQSSRAYGCLLGGALGDALGSAPAHAGEGPLHFSGTTQLAMYSLDGLLDALEWANAGTGADVNACIWLAYLRWYLAQEGSLPPSAPSPQPRWIDGQELLHRRRSPDRTSLSGLATGDMGTSFRPVNPEAKGSATVSRSAPFGLVPHIESPMVFKISTDAASLTHGHPSARQAAGLFSSLIHHLCAGMGLIEAAATVLDAAREADRPAPELVVRLESAQRLAEQPRLPREKVLNELGEGHSAEEALAVGLYAVLATAEGADGPRTPQEHVRASLSIAAGHGNAAPAIGCIAGSLLGAFYGEQCLPEEWLEALEGQDAIRTMADQLLKVTVAAD